MKNKQLIILGAGVSIQNGINKNLWRKIQNKFVIGLNYSFNYFDSTFHMYVDNQFYIKQHKQISKLPLIVGTYFDNLKIHKNTITLPTSNKYDSTLIKGVYKQSLCGIFALSIAIYLQPKEIYLLGFDAGSVTDNIIKKRIETHFYQKDIVHRGTGKVWYYNIPNRVNKDFKPFENQTNIYNVSLDSKINTFQKISYDDFFNRLDNDTYNQNNLREQIKISLNKIKRENT